MATTENKEISKRDRQLGRLREVPDKKLRMTKKYTVRIGEDYDNYAAGLQRAEKHFSDMFASDLAVQSF